MSGAQLLEFKPDLELANLSFSDLEIRFKKHLEHARSVSDLERLIRSVKPLFQDKHYSSAELMCLKKLRQKVYDRKRIFQLQDATLAPDLDISVAKPGIKKPTLNAALNKEKNLKTLPSTNKRTNLANDGHKKISVASFDDFAKTSTPKNIIWLIVVAIVSFFLWHQSLALYQSAGFENPVFTAAGGIIMIIGFAAYHSLSRSWLALFFCLYAGAYEGYLMISGTLHDDKQAVANVLANDSHLIFLQENYDKERANYHELKQRYDDPESKVFKNDWFRKTHLNPAWEANTKARELLNTKKAALTVEKSVGHITWLKIFYRLGLVFLCMVCVHQLFQACIANEKKKFLRN